VCPAVSGQGQTKIAAASSTLVNNANVCSQDKKPAIGEDPLSRKPMDKLNSKLINNYGVKLEK